MSPRRSERCAQHRRGPGSCVSRCPAAAATGREPRGCPPWNRPQPLQFIARCDTLSKIRVRDPDARPLRLRPIGAPTGARTPDPRIKSPLLCQLSYGGGTILAARTPSAPRPATGRGRAERARRLNLNLGLSLCVGGGPVLPRPARSRPTGPCRHPGSPSQWRLHGPRETQTVRRARPGAGRPGSLNRCFSRLVGRDGARLSSFQPWGSGVAARVAGEDATPRGTDHRTSCGSGRPREGPAVNNPFAKTARIAVTSSLVAASLATAGLVLSPTTQTCPRRPT